MADDAAPTLSQTQAAAEDAAQAALKQHPLVKAAARPLLKADEGARKQQPGNR